MIKVHGSINCVVFVAIIMMTVLASQSAAHTMLHFGLFNTSRTVDMYPDHLLISYKSTLASSLETSTSIMIVDTDGDGRLSTQEKDGVSSAAMEYLALDLTVFLDRNQLPLAPVKAVVTPNLKGFELAMKVAIPPKANGITTQAITIIDPAFAFPPMDSNRKVPDTQVICHSSQYADNQDHARERGEIPSESSTVIPWNRYLNR